MRLIEVLKQKTIFKKRTHLPHLPGSAKKKLHTCLCWYLFGFARLGRLGFIPARIHTASPTKPNFAAIMQFCLARIHVGNLDGLTRVCLSIQNSSRTLLYYIPNTIVGLCSKMSAFVLLKLRLSHIVRVRNRAHSFSIF